MPKLYEFLGLLIYFYSREHKPIHVHAKSGEGEARAEIVFKKGKLQPIVVKNIRSRKHLNQAQKADLRRFVQERADEIVAKWEEFFIYGKKPKFEKITRRVK